MSENSAVLALPYIQAAQAQKHVTHNEALRALDVIVQAAVIDRTRTTPPTDPTTGDRHLVAAGATDAWAGRDHAIAVWEISYWAFYMPAAGWSLRVLTEEARTIVFDGTAWVGDALRPDTLGVNAPADAVNRLAVASDATLLTHAGAGHQLKINKAADADTASLLFQSDWTGHAEMGLAGDTDFAIKVSPDGGTWLEALRFAADGGVSGSALQETPDDIRPNRLMRADYGYGPGNVVGTVSQTAGAPSGAVIERGDNANGSYVRWADGTQMCWQQSGTLTADQGAIGTTGFSASEIYTWVFPASFIATPITSVSARRLSGAHSHWGMVSSSHGTWSSRRSFYMAAENGATGTLITMASGRWF